MAAYAILSGNAKKNVVRYKRPVVLGLALYDVGTQSVTLVPKDRAKLIKLMQLRITTALLLDTLSRPVNNGHGIVVTINKSAFSITS